MACSSAACPRTLQLWCDAYCECARELNGPRALAQVILFGRHESSLAVRVVEGDTEVSVALGGGAEPTTSTDQGVIETVIEERKNDFGAAKSRLQLLAVNQSYALLAATASSCQPVAGRRPSCRRREGEAAGWSESPARPITQADLATLTEKVRRRVVRWFRMQRFLDADVAAGTPPAILRPAAGCVEIWRDAGLGT